MQTFIKSSRLAAIGIVVGLLSVSGSALADDTATMAVTASVASSCDISASALGFGAYNPIVAADVDATATVNVTCTSGFVTNVRLDDGVNQNTGSTDAAPLRRAVSGLNFLNYQLYSDTARETVWANTDATDVGHTGTGQAVALTVYGRIPMSQNVPTGTYTDTITATVIF